ncbi:MAG: hypothetical protein ACRC54_08220 [Fusobacteriaceae bacterium]
MLEKQIKEKGILANLITLINLIEEDISELLEGLNISYLEYSVLNNILITPKTTQYEISKRYNISIQRAHQIIKKFEREAYIVMQEEVKSGRTIKKLLVNEEVRKKIEEINNKIINRAKTKKIKPKKLELLNTLLKELIESF